MCRVLCIAVLAVVISMGSALAVNTRFDNQPVGPATCSLTPDSSSSSKILSSFSLFANGILC